MTMFRSAVLGALLFSVASSTQALAGAKPLWSTTCTPFPANSWWQADISKLPVHAKSDDWMNSMDKSRNIWPDFGPSYGVINGPYGIPITIVSNATPTVPVKFFYAAESDKVRYPLGSHSKVEGWRFDDTGSDRHVITINRDTCRLYETWATFRDSSGQWNAGSGATWSLKSNRLRPIQWTSADAAGLPIFPGLLRYDEVLTRNIQHAIRFTTPNINGQFSWPARHRVYGINQPNWPPMGVRFRIKASYKIPATLRADTKAVLWAMKKYGIVLADNGQPWYFQGQAHSSYPQPFLDELKNIPASIFEAVDTSSLKISNDSMQVRQP
jgi:hypothetical protein